MNIGIFGKPRSGKTTLEAKYIYQNEKKEKLKEDFPRFFKLLHLKEPYTKIYCTDPAIKGCTYFDPKTLGMWKPEEGSLVILAEAGIIFSNRNTLTLSEFAERFFALYGHMKIDVIYDSQSVDIDIKLRNRTDYFFIVEKKYERAKKSVVQRINYRLGVNQETKKIDELYEVNEGLGWKFLYRILGQRFTLHRKKYYHLFDSWSDDFDYPMSSHDDMIGYEAVMLSQKKIGRKKVRK